MGTGKYVFGELPTSKLAKLHVLDDSLNHAVEVTHNEVFTNWVFRSQPSVSHPASFLILLRLPVVALRMLLLPTLLLNELRNAKYNLMINKSHQ